MSKASQIKKAIDDMDKTFEAFELDSGDCRMLQNHYANIMADTNLLVGIASARNKTVEQVYHDCKKATVILGNRIKYLQGQAERK